MAANLTEGEWGIVEQISEAYALPDTPGHLDPVAFNRLLRSRTPARGKRFTHDHHDTCAYIARSKNLNVVAYTANFVVADVPANTTEANSPSPDGNATVTATRTTTTASAQVQQHHQHHHNQSTQKTQQLPVGKVFAVSGLHTDCDFNVQNPMHPYFVNLEPSYLADRRKKGIVGDCDDLKMLERRFAYGYNAKLFDCEKHFKEQLPAHMKHDGPLYTAIASSAAGAAAVEGVQQLPMLSGLSKWWQSFQPMMGAFVALPVWPAVLLRLKPLTPPPSTTTTQEGQTEGGAEEEAWCHDDSTLPVIIAVIDKKLSVLEKVYVKSIERWMRLPSVEYIEVFGVGLADGKPTYEKLDNSGQYQPPADVSKEEMAEAMKN